MMQRTTASSFRSSFFEFRSLIVTGITAAALMAATFAAPAQDAAPTADSTASQTAAQSGPAEASPAATEQNNELTFSNQKKHKQRKAKEDKIVESKATKADQKKIRKGSDLAKLDNNLPDKVLYDKAEDAIKHGRFDVGRLDLQTLLNTYPDSEFMMRAKLAVADSWYKEGGVAALTQAEQEYKDFITFFPNAPEAAEAQMRVGDIYFREMDKPDRDYTTTQHAEDEYRLMLQQFPDSPLVPQARQRLREVQEVLASREANIGAFYAERQPPNLPAAIARYQTVVDDYPLYSHLDDVLIGLGDAYEAESKFVRTMRLPEAGKARLEKIYDDEAQSAYDKVVLEHAAAPHVEDAKDRLAAMGLPIPTPTAQQLAASTELENSRGQYTLSKRAAGFLLRRADTVPAATAGAPSLEDPPPVSAATIVHQAISDFNTSMNPKASQPPTTEASAAPEAPAATEPAPTEPAPPVAAAPLALQNVPTATAAQSGDSSAVTEVQQASPSTTSATGTSTGIEIVQPGSGTEVPITHAPATPPAFPGSTPAASPATSGFTPGLPTQGAANTAPMAPIEKPEAAPAVINEAAGTRQPAAQTAPANGKKPKVAFDKSDQSSSKHKKKKGLAKINPF